MLFKKRMQVNYFIAVMEPGYIFPQHARLGHTRPDDRTRGHQRNIIIASQAFSGICRMAGDSI